ncbi:hypothetical protein TorRG33x02_008700, partial [Trema orientale]
QNTVKVKEEKDKHMSSGWILEGQDRQDVVKNYEQESTIFNEETDVMGKAPPIPFSISFLEKKKAVDQLFFCINSHKIRQRNPYLNQLLQRSLLFVSSLDRERER